MMKVATLTIVAILQLSGVVNTSAAATADNVDIVKRLRSSERKHKSDEQQQRYLSTVTEPTMSMSMSMSHSMSMSVSVPSCAPIYEIGKSDPNFSTLMSLIDLAQLAVVLQGPASFTVVAPPNSAFEALPAETVAFLTAPENLEALQGVLLYHVFSPAATSSEITTGEYESKMGATVSVTNVDGAITVNDATVIAADIMACNGIIHVIDKVLIPPTPAPEPEMSMSMSHSMSVSADTKCHFCMDGMPDPDLVLPTPDGETCQQASDYAHTLTVDDAMCPTVLAAEALCCPAGVTEPTAPTTVVCPKTWQCLHTTTAPTLDGNLDDWVDVLGIESSLRSHFAVDGYYEDTAKFKCQYDDTSIYMAMEIPGQYQFSATDDHLCASIATMFKVGVNAEFYNMGNCPNAGIGSSCSSSILDVCDTYRVDIGAHWELSGTKQGTFYPLNTTYPGSGNDLLANKDDEWAVSSYCRFDDDGSNAGNEWSGSWKHTNSIIGEDGNYIFELSRLLQTPSNKTDAQLKAGETYSVGLAFWIPTSSEEGWGGADHYVTGCGEDWIELELAAAPINAPATVPTSEPTSSKPDTVECSCTPTEYTFVVDASTDCTFDTVKGNPGIGSTFCFLGSTPVTRQVVEITSVQFVEFDTSGKLIVINQDDTYATVSEMNGSTFTFKSISSELDAAVALNDQLDMVPGGIQITVDAKIDGVIYNNRVAWNYSNKCGKYPIADTEGVGWVALHHNVQAAPAFCDVTSAPLATPVTTDAPVAGTVTTEAPVAGEVHTTDAPVAGEVHNTDAPAVHHGKAGKVAKSAKAKGSKDGGSMRLLMDAYANDELMDAFANL